MKNVAPRSAAPRRAAPRRAAPPPLNALRAFEAFARHGGMTAAAAELCVTHGAVSRQVRALQEALGVVLVTGPRHRLVLTPAGSALAQQLSTGFDLINEAVAAARARARAREDQEIEISCLGTLSMKWLIPRLPDFLATHPQIRVRLSEAHGTVDFTRDRFDGAIRILNPGESAGRAEATPFLAQYQGPVVAPHLAGPGIALEDLLRLPRLHASTFRDSWRLWAELTQCDLAPGPVEREFGHNHSMIEAAVSGMGAAIAPWAFVAPDVQSGRLAAPFGFALRPSHFVFLQPVGRKDPGLDAFRDWLVSKGAETPAPPEAWPGYSLDRS